MINPIQTNKENSVCFSGHRPKNLAWGYNENHPDCKKLKEKLQKTILNLVNKGKTTFYCGLAEGFDLYVGEILIALKQQNFQIKIIGCLPCKDQAKYYHPASIDKYIKILASCDDLYYASSGHYFNGCTIKRNKYMVDNSSILVCYATSAFGGSASTLRYAMKKDLTIIEL